MVDVPGFGGSEELVAVLRSARSARTIAEVLNEACAMFGYEYYALTHHIDFAARPGQGVRIHNYPEGWSDWFDTKQLNLSDPIHRASHRAVAGFRWRDVPQIISLTAMDRHVLHAARDRGIGDGLTIPANVPGEALGSCSFATAMGCDINDATIPNMQWIGAFAFEAARRLERSKLAVEPASLTERQRDCVYWQAKGKTDRQIASILGVRHLTVTEHMKNARIRYNVNNRAMLTVRALFDGAISFSDLLKP